VEKKNILLPEPDCCTV